jgi:uncharacterized protein DUF998
MRQPAFPTRREPDTMLASVCGVVAVVGALALVASNLIGSMLVPGHDWMADTISDLAAGKYEIIQDVGMYLYVAALLGLAIGAAHLHTGTRAWSGMSLGLALIALCVTIIAARNEYGDGDNDGVVIHIYVVYAMGLLFVATFAMAAWYETTFRIRAMSAICAGLWVVGAPAFFMSPTAYDGGIERALGVVSACWVGAVGVRFLQAARAN